MWLTGRLAAHENTPSVRAGKTTIGGESAAVVLRGEQREIPVVAPGGYVWRPSRGDTVLVVRDGEEEKGFIVAEEMSEIPGSMRDGEVFLHVPGGASLYLRADGTVELKGDLRVSGTIRALGEE